MGLQRVPQSLFEIQIIVIPPANLFNLQDTRHDHFFQYSLYSALGYANLDSDFPRCRLGFVCKTNQYMCVVTEKSPFFIQLVLVILFLSSY